MSKSFFNVVTPDSVIDEFGADSLRMHEMFLGPLTQHKPWNTDGITGVASFLKKFWSLFHSRDNGEFYLENIKPTKDELIQLHKTIKKIRTDIESFSFNTSISSFMIFVNYLKKNKCYKKEILEPLVLMMSPFAPFICEEIWEKINKNDRTIYNEFPQYDDSLLIDKNINYPIAINGKKKTNITMNQYQRE